MGSVGSVTVDKDGKIIDYRLVLEGSDANANTWISFDETANGNIYQVDADDSGQ